MRPRALIDTGPLVAFLNRRDHLHPWAREVFAATPGPYLTSEGNIAEICRLLERTAFKGSLPLFELIETGLLQVASLNDALSAVQIQIARFRDRQVDFADACLLVLADYHSPLPIMTVDRADFVVYFRGRTKRLILPPA